MTKVVVVDDQCSVRETLKDYLATEPDIEIVGFADNGKAAIQQVEEFLPDIVLMDIEMPVMDGLTATQIISERFVSTKVLLLTMKDDKRELTKALEVGAWGYILKNTNPKDISNIIRLTLQGYYQVGPVMRGNGSTKSLFSAELIDKPSDNCLDPHFVLTSLITNVSRLEETILLHKDSLINLNNKYINGQEQIKTKLSSERFFSELNNIKFESRKTKVRLNRIEKNLLFMGGFLLALTIIIFLILLILSFKLFLV
jgi:DNA-binding NarL/FixJ family response regulator